MEHLETQSYSWLGQIDMAEPQSGGRPRTAMMQLEGELSTSPQTSYAHCGGDGGPPWQLISHQGQPVAALSVDQTEARVRLGLVFLEGDRVVDVSIQPGAWVGKLRHSAGLFGANPDRWEADVRRELLAGGESEGWWTPATGDPQQLDLVGLAARSAWPLLRLCTDDVREVPRWATGLLRGPDPVSAVRRQFGTRANRPLVRAVAQHLCGSIHWWSLACVLATHSLDADRAVRLLEAAVGDPSDDHLCSIEEFRLLERTLGVAPASVVLRLLRSAGDGGPKRILQSLDSWDRARDRVGPLRPTADELERRLIQLGEPTVAVEAAVPLDPLQRLVAMLGDDAVGAVSGSGQPVNVAISHPEPVIETRDWCAPRVAPTVDLREQPATFDHPSRARAFHRERDGRVDLLLPVDPDHLVEWSRLLRNCLHDYVGPVATGESVVLGIRVDEQLVGALELNRRGQIRQMVGRANRPLDEWMNQAVLAILARVRARRAA